MSPWVCSAPSRYGVKWRAVSDPVVAVVCGNSGNTFHFRAKYLLAIVDALLDAFGPNIGGGYDIGCGFGKTINKSPLGKKAQTNSFRCLVGSFHGHAHNRLCQLSFLATYVPGMGLEDLEGCERFFSKSNALARSTRYASIFHRRQTITTYLAHTDVYDTYANLSELSSHRPTYHYLTTACRHIPCQ
jgi:hypothetical protein